MNSSYIDFKTRAYILFYLGIKLDPNLLGMSPMSISWELGTHSGGESTDILWADASLKCTI